MEPSDPQTKEKIDEITTRVLRIPARPLARSLAKFNITPNQITVLSFLFGVAGAFFLIKGGYNNQVIGALFAFAYMLLDCTDGEIARIKKLGSKFGAWLDGITGFIINPFLLLALSLGIDTTLSLSWGLLAVIAYPLQYLFVFFYKSEISEDKKKLEMPLPNKLEAIRYIYGSALLFPILLVGVLLNKALWVLYFFAIIGNLFWMTLILLQYCSLKQLK